MTPDRLRDCIVHLGVEPPAFASFIGYSERMMRNWLAGSSPIPRVVALLVESMVATTTTIDEAEALIRRRHR